MKEKHVYEPIPLPYRRIWQEAGVPLLSFTATSPAALHAHIRDYLARYAAVCVHYCDTRLYPDVRDAYLANDDPRRRYTHPRTAYTLACSCREEGEVIVVTLSHLFVRGATRRKHEFFISFSAADGGCLKPKRRRRKRNS